MRARTERPRGPRAGFVLLEAVVALAILSVVSLALVAATAAQTLSAAKATELLVSQSLAEDRLGAIRVLDHAGLSDPPDSLLSGTFAPPFERFAWQATIAAMEDEHDLFGVEVVVLGPAERYPLRTLVHRPRPVVTTTAGDG
jgi:type II secretory pathway pseudopilin PulG